MNLHPETTRTDEKATEAREALERVGLMVSRDPMQNRLGPPYVQSKPLAELTGRELFGAWLRARDAADDEGRLAAFAEATRRLAAQGWLEHGELRSDKCDRCGETCGTPAGLVRHLRAAHPWRAPDATSRVLDNLRAAGVPRLPGTKGGPDLADALLKGELGYTAAVKSTDGWPASGEGRTLVLLGDPGCGKTWAACAVLAQASGLFLRAAELGRPMPDDQRHRALYHSGVVVVDDLGEEHIGSSGYALSVIDELVTTRHDCGRATLLTSNLRADCAGPTVRCGKCLRCRYGERMWSRARKVEVGGKDLRR